MGFEKPNSGIPEQNLPSGWLKKKWIENEAEATKQKQEKEKIESDPELYFSEQEKFFSNFVFESQREQLENIEKIRQCVLASIKAEMPAQKIQAILDLLSITSVERKRINSLVEVCRDMSEKAERADFGEYANFIEMSISSYEASLAEMDKWILLYAKRADELKIA